MVFAVRFMGWCGVGLWEGLWFFAAMFVGMAAFEAIERRMQPREDL